MNHDPLHFTQMLVCELPFILNLPTEGYPVKIDGKEMQLLVGQDYYALFKRARPIGFVPRDAIARLGVNSWDTALPLHTIILYQESVVVPYEDSLKIGESEIKNILRSEEIRRWVLNLQNRLEDSELDRIVSEKFSELDAIQYQHYVKIALAWENQPSIERQDFFVKCVNYLIKSYMAYFRDPFAHEITLNRLASGDFIPGVQCLVVDTKSGNILYGVNRIGHAPPILRSQWAEHPENIIQKFKHTISLGQVNDPVALLQVRSYHFIHIGAYRSAIIEASAALETCVARKIRKYMLAAGESEPDVCTFLRQRGNWRFEERAKKMLKEKTGVSAADIDPVLWQEVQDRRTNYRDRIAHSDKDPNEQEAKDTVKIFLALIDLINKKIPDPS